MRTIPLSNSSLMAIVDDEDYSFISRNKWLLHRSGYAVRTSSRMASGTRKSVRFWMHRQINQTPDGLDTDHVNRIKLDNRKANLRTATRRQNQGNQSPRKCKTSAFRGVCFNKQSGLWRAEIGRQEGRRFLGYFDSETQAALAYNVAALQFFGEFAFLNTL